MSKRTTAVDPAVEEQIAELASMDQAAAAQPAVEVEQAAKAEPAAQPPEPPAADAADPGSERPAPVPLWDEHEHVPSGGGSFIRMPDGSLVKEEEA